MKKAVEPGVPFKPSVGLSGVVRGDAAAAEGSTRRKRPPGSGAQNERAARHPKEIEVTRDFLLSRLLPLVDLEPDAKNAGAICRAVQIVLDVMKDFPPRAARAPLSPEPEIYEPEWLRRRTQ